MSKCFTVSPNEYNVGFSVKFANNIVVSVRWGAINYSNGQTTAECAAWDDATGKWVRVLGFEYDGDDVLPHVSADEVARFMRSASVMTNQHKETNQ
jgi:hypothetical protein